MRTRSLSLYTLPLLVPAAPSHAFAALSALSLLTVAASYAVLEKGNICTPGSLSVQLLFPQLVPVAVIRSLLTRLRRALVFADLVPSFAPPAAFWRPGLRIVPLFSVCTCKSTTDRHRVLICLALDRKKCWQRLEVLLVTSISYLVLVCLCAALTVSLRSAVNGPYLVLLSPCFPFPSCLLGIERAKNALHPIIPLLSATMSLRLRVSCLCMLLLLLSSRQPFSRFLSLPLTCHLSRLESEHASP